MQITPLIPINSQGTIAPDSATVLSQVIQQLMDQNKPKTNIDQSTPDQQAAAEADTKAKEKGKKPVLPAGDTIKPKEDAAGTPSLMDMFDKLFGGGSDPNAPKGESPKAEQHTGGLTNLRNTLKGEGGGGAGGGKVGDALKFFAMFM